MYEEENFEIDSQSYGAHTTLEKYTAKTFGIMALGLLVTAITAFVLNINYIGLRMWIGFPYLPIVLVVAQLGVAVAFTARLFKASVTTTRVMFFIYSILTGFTFSILQYVYDSTTIFLAFGITCVYFAALCVIGFTTKMNLSKIFPILMVGLIAIIIFNIASMFINLEAMDRVVCSVALVIFTLLTAYDTQKMKNLFEQYQGDELMLSRLSMYSALELYLDFINLFLRILQILGRNSRN